MKKRMKWLIPLSAVAIVAVVAAVALILHLSAPDPIVYEPGTVIYQDDQVTAKVVEPAAQRQIIYSMYGPMSEDELFDRHHIIATGIVRNIREVEVSYIGTGGPESRVVTLFDFYVNEYLKDESSEESSKSILTVGWSYSSYDWVEDLPELQEDAEFLFFLEAMDRLEREDSMGRQRYANAWVYSPTRLGFEFIDGKYNVSSFFAEFFPDIEHADIETQLVELIQQKLSLRQEVS